MANLLDMLMQRAQQKPNQGVVGSTMSAIPQDPLLGGLSSGLGAVRDFGNKVNVPYLGGMGDMVVGKTPEEVENWSYGNSPFQSTEMGLPQIKQERKQSLFDALSSLMPGVRMTVGLPVGMSIKVRPTVADALRSDFPGIYDRPDVLAQKALAKVTPEDSSMKQLFGVDRNDLYDIRQTRTAGNEAPNIFTPGAARGSAAADRVMTPKNTKRLIDVLGELGQHPRFYKGMDAWYEMQPLFDRLKQISDNPVNDFNRFQNFTGMASPMSDVLTEINRGSAALMKSNQGNFGDFIRYGNKGGQEGAPDDLQGLVGHIGHKSAQLPAMKRYHTTGKHSLITPKVPLYIQSAGVPETGFQMEMPVGDAHWSRGVGLADVRTSKDTGDSVSMPELRALSPWWAKIAKKVGTNPVNAQARAWGGFADATGVDSPIGAPKLELISKSIMDAAKAYGISPEEARDKILTGKLFARR